ncbi:MAG: hypothetical protein K6E78_04315, partial [Treponema sp.]|nr:hypothetical protein [Treponema sp.]
MLNVTVHLMATTKSSKSTGRNTTKSTKSAGAARPSKSRRASPRRSRRKGPLYTAAGIILFLAGLAWFFGGKPRVEFGTEGRIVTLIQTEEPLFYVVFPGLKPHSNSNESFSEKENNGEGAAASALSDDFDSSSSTEKDSSVQTKTPDAKKGTQGSFSGDLGHPENNPLFLGNPTDALDELSSGQNYLMVKPQFTLS